MGSRRPDAATVRTSISAADGQPSDITLGERPSSCRHQTMDWWTNGRHKLIPLVTTDHVRDRAGPRAGPRRRGQYLISEAGGGIPMNGASDHRSERHGSARPADGHFITVDIRRIRYELTVLDATGSLWTRWKNSRGL